MSIHSIIHRINKRPTDRPSARIETKSSCIVQQHNRHFLFLFQLFCFCLCLFVFKFYICEPTTFDIQYILLYIFYVDALNTQSKILMVQLCVYDCRARIHHSMKIEHSFFFPFFMIFVILRSFG